MALVVKDRVQETSTTTGTGTLTLSGAVTGYQTFSSAIGNTNTTYYAIQNGAEWEVGIGTVGAGTLSRDTVLESSNSGSLVNFSAGSKFVFCTYPAEKSVYVDSSGNVNLTGNILLDNGSADGAQLTLASSGYSNWNLDNYSGRFRAYYNATEYFTIDASGNVGIGTNSPSTWASKLTVLDGTVSVASSAGANYGFNIFTNGQTTNNLTLAQGFGSATDNVGYLYNRANAAFVFGTNNTERMRIDSSGVITSTLGGMQVISGTSQASTSGTSITFSSIPSWVKKITLILNGVSTNGTSPLRFRLGYSGGIETSGYLGVVSNISGGVATSNITDGIAINRAMAAASVVHGLITVENLSGNIWVASGVTGLSNAVDSWTIAASKTTTGTLTQVSVTTVNGTDTFDAGNINIIYE